MQITGISSFQNGDFAIVGQFSGSMTLGSTNLQTIMVRKMFLFLVSVMETGFGLCLQKAMVKIVLLM